MLVAAQQLTAGVKTVEKLGTNGRPAVIRGRLRPVKKLQPALRSRVVHRTSCGLSFRESQRFYSSNLRRSVSRCQTRNLNSGRCILRLGQICCTASSCAKKCTRDLTV